MLLQIVVISLTATFILPGSDAYCYDLNPFCQDWARRGECARNPGYMRIYCKKSCGLCPTPPTLVRGCQGCGDYNTRCSGWASRGECRRNPPYMLRYCRFSCKVCSCPRPKPPTELPTPPPIPTTQRPVTRRTPPKPTTDWPSPPPPKPGTGMPPIPTKVLPSPPMPTTEGPMPPLPGTTAAPPVPPMTETTKPPVPPMPGTTAGPVPPITETTAGPVPSTPETTAGPIRSTPGTTAGPVPSTQGTTAGPVRSTPGTTAGPVPSTQGTTEGPITKAPGTTAGPITQAPGTTAGPITQPLGTSARPITKAPGTTERPITQAPGTTAGPETKKPETTAASTPMPGTTIPPIPVCKKPLRVGVEKRILPGEAFKASSSESQWHKPEEGRLNNQESDESVGAWCSALLDDKQYIKVNLGESRNITAILSQGRESELDKYVTKYSVDYSEDGTSWESYKDENDPSKDKVFEGNSDNTSIKINKLKKFILTKHLRIRPVEWKNMICMRLEFEYCSDI